MNRWISAVFFTVGTIAPQSCMAATPDDSSAAVQDGKLIAERECSSCHATGREGPSPRADAPVFRAILARYHADTLETELVEGIKLGHPDMPLFKLNPGAVDDLIQYLRSIRE